MTPTRPAADTTPSVLRLPALARTLDAYVTGDPRVLGVYRRARRAYDEGRLPHHNFLHIVRDLYRALLIAESEPAVDYRVLIPAVLLHDIGFFTPDYKTLGHDVTGARLAREWLAALGDYSEGDIEAICHCIRAHKGKAEMPQSLEARILYDADVLEKAGAVYLIMAGRITCEFDETIEHFLERETKGRAAEVARGYYTRKAKELDGGRLERVSRLLNDVRAEILADRSDVGFDESALWAGRPPD